RVVLLGPAHRVAPRALALPAAGALATPLGTVEVDRELAAEACRLPQVEVDDAPHRHEHALEVELPFLQRLLHDFRVLPLVVGAAPAAAVAEVVARLWGGGETVVVVSSDLSHYLPYDQARRLDADTAQKIVSLDGPLRPDQACGAFALNGLLLALGQRRFAGRVVDLRSSGDTSGDRDRVVGYGAFHFHPA
ncbi:MAG: AmmeMemoRadiSam system protein B, partial [Thermoanaerobaculia bacterium]|nr:AmmeMemoRadiSam system protein B [Thermoanaerobaculia bacterium]